MDNEGQQGNVIKPGSEPESNWKFTAVDTNEGSMAGQDMGQTAQPPIQAGQSAVSWTASEFISHDKSGGWYAQLAIAAVLLAAVVLLLTHDIVPVVVVIIVTITFGVLAARKPRQLEYKVDGKGLYIGEKFYPYSGFRSFSVVREEAVESIWFMPLKRFMPPISIYFDPNDGKKIVDVLAKTLPVENRQLDAVDRLMHRIRF